MIDNYKRREHSEEVKTTGSYTNHYRTQSSYHYNNNNKNYNNNNSNNSNYTYKKPQIPYRLTNPSASTNPLYRQRYSSSSFSSSSFYSRNYKDQAEKPLPKFRSNEICGYRKNVYENNPKIMKLRSKPTILHKNITKTFPNERELKFENEDTSKDGNTVSKKDEFTKKPQDSCSHRYIFRVKLVDSYREFCKIKSKSSVNLDSKYDSIAFLKSIMMSNDELAIIVFFDGRERIFYGAAAVCLDDLAEKEELDTYAIESMILRLNWIYLSEVHESDLNTEIQADTFALNPEIGMNLLGLMEQFETQLHDVKKIRPVKLKVKMGQRLEELEEFFKLTEGKKQVSTAIGKDENLDMSMESFESLDFVNSVNHLVESEDYGNPDSLESVKHADSGEFTEPVDSDDDFFADYE